MLSYQTKISIKIKPTKPQQNYNKNTTVTIVYGGQGYCNAAGPGYCGATVYCGPGYCGVTVHGGPGYCGSCYCGATVYIREHDPGYCDPCY